MLWKSNGKRIFVNTKKISKNIINNISSNKKLTIANISKYDYSHHEISTTSVPLHFKILHHLRNTRPNWYHKYHSYSISHYLHFAILVIVMSALGFGFYQKFIQETGTKSIALAGPISPNRVLSFQGRLTDSNDIPITSQKKNLDLVFTAMRLQPLLQPLSHFYGRSYELPLLMLMEFLAYF